MKHIEIHQRTAAADAALVERFRGLPVANISDVMFRLHAGGARLRPMHDATPMAGVALTVKTRPGDNLLVHKALLKQQPSVFTPDDSELGVMLTTPPSWTARQAAAGTHHA